MRLHVPVVQLAGDASSRTSTVRVQILPGTPISAPCCNRSELALQAWERACDSFRGYASVVECIHSRLRICRGKPHARATRVAGTILAPYPNAEGISLNLIQYRRESDRSYRSSDGNYNTWMAQTHPILGGNPSYCTTEDTRMLHFRSSLLNCRTSKVPSVEFAHLPPLSVL